MAEAVMSALAEDNIRVRQLAVRDIPVSGKPAELLDAAGISARHIVEHARALARETAAPRR